MSEVKPMITLQERAGGQQTINDMLMQKTMKMSRVAMPAIIESFDIVEQTVTVQPSIMERIVDEDGQVKEVTMPVLLDVPIVFPRAGGYSLTMPVVKGDECLVVFADFCIDAWWASGGVQAQEDSRRHDLSDGFAILGTWSQPRKVKNYDSTKAKLVHEASGNGVEVDSSGVNLIGSAKVNGQSLDSYIVSISGPWPHSHG